MCDIVKENHCSKTQLQRRGWTEYLISTHLGQPCYTCENPVSEEVGPPMLLWSNSRVAAAENKPEFGDYLSRIYSTRLKISKGVQDSVQRKVMDHLVESMSLPISIVLYCERDLIDQVHEQFSVEIEGLAVPGPEYSLSESAVHWRAISRIIFTHTNYLDLFRKLKGRIGWQLATSGLWIRLLKIIKREYELLADECDKWLLELRTELRTGTMLNPHSGVLNYWVTLTTIELDKRNTK